MTFYTVLYTILFHKSLLVQDGNPMFFSKTIGKKMLFKAILGDLEWKIFLLRLFSSQKLSNHF